MTRRYPSIPSRLAPQCPACGGSMHNDPALNATSRYVRVIICSECGTREAFHGMFWDERDPYSEGAIRDQLEWKRAWR